MVQLESQNATFYQHGECLIAAIYSDTYNSCYHGYTTQESVSY